MKITPKGKGIHLFALFCILVLLIAVSLFLGRYSGSPLSVPSTILYSIRLPRIILACLVGLALSVSGCVFQNVFHNPLASPDFLGASSGACFGAALAILLRVPQSMIFIVAFLFGIFTVLLVYITSKLAWGNATITLLLVGMILSSIFSAGTSFVKLVADPADQLPSITYWLMGSLNNVKITDLAVAFFPILIGFIPLAVLSYRINLLSLSAEEAQSMGINVSRLRFVVILCATLLTAASVSACGTIGWIGLIIPNICRRIFGNNCTILIPATALSGAAFLLLADDMSRTLFAVEIPIGIITAIIGAPFFLIFIIRHSKEGVQND